jgi:hypothetical protein
VVSETLPFSPKRFGKDIPERFLNENGIFPHPKKKRKPHVNDVFECQSYTQFLMDFDPPFLTLRNGRWPTAAFLRMLWYLALASVRTSKGATGKEKAKKGGTTDRSKLEYDLWPKISVTQWTRRIFWSQRTSQVATIGIPSGNLT